MAASRSAATASAPSAGKIVLVGASGGVGKATIRALSKSGGCSRLLICSRNPSSSCASEYCSKGCRCVHGDLNDVESLKPNFSGASAVFIITPGAENRAELVQNGLNAAKAAGVPFVMVVSVCTADSVRTVFGGQFNAIERATKACGLPYTLLRLPIFHDTWSIEFDELREGGLYNQFDPSIMLTSVSLSDVGECAAVILQNPSLHHNKTYNIVGPAWCLNDARAAFSTALGKRIEFQPKSYDETKEILRGKGFADWMARGMCDMFQAMGEGRYNFSKDSDFKKLTGHDPMTLQRWVELHRDLIVGDSHRGASGSATGRGAEGEAMKHKLGTEARHRDVGGHSVPLEASGTAKSSAAAGTAGARNIPTTTGGGGRV